MIFIFLMAALWAIPISRAISFIGYTKKILNEEQTLNALNDVHYGVSLLVLYCICLVANLVLCVLFAKKYGGAVLLLLAAPIWMVVQIIWYKPEEVIILIPSINPLHLLGMNLIPLFIGLSLVGIAKLKLNSFGNARTN
jgi:hypothetical protein